LPSLVPALLAGEVAILRLTIRGVKGKLPDLALTKKVRGWVRGRH